MTVAPVVRRVLIGCAVVLLPLVLLARAVRVPYASTEQAMWDRNTGEIHGNIEVGQTFESVRAHLAAVGVQVATYSGRANTEEVIFELRQRPTDQEVLRTVRANARTFGDHQVVLFEFEPVPDSLGKVYYASLRSPTSRPGNAIAVDFSAANPYAKPGPSHLFLLRAGRADSAAVEHSLKEQADVAFTVVHRVPLSERVRLAGRALFLTLQQQPGQGWLFARLLAASLIVAVLVVLPARWFRVAVDPRLFPYVLGGLLILGLFWRLLYARHLPFTNDEGSMLYDAWTALQGRLPGGDGLLKTPAAIGMHAIGLQLLGPHLLTGRIVSLLASLATVFPLLALGRSLGLGRRGTIALAAVWLLAAAPAIFGIYVHAQPVQMLAGTAGLAFFAAALAASGTVRGPGSRRMMVFGLLAGICFGLALIARKSSLAFALPAIALLALHPRALRSRIAAVVATAGGLVAVIAVTTLLVQNLYGPDGVRYFLGIDIAAIDPDTTATAEERRAALIRGVLPFFREALPITLLALIGIGGVLENLVRRRMRHPLARLLWGAPIAAALYGSSYLRSYERGEQLAFGVLAFWTAIVVVLIMLAVLPRRRAAGDEEVAREERPLLSTTERAGVVPERFPVREQLRWGSAPVRSGFARSQRSAQRFGRAAGDAGGPAVFVAAAWMLGAVVMYASWIKFTANYLAEFLPALVLLAGAGVAWCWQCLPLRRVTIPLLAVLVFWGALSSARSGYDFPHTGTFDLETLQDVVGYVRKNVPSDEPLLTAAVAIPVASGHRVPFDVAHPTHYAYGFIEPEVRNVYMAPVEQLLAVIRRDVDWVVLERLTAFSYFREYPDVEQLVQEEFEETATFDNLSNPITVLRRRSTPSPVRPQ